MQLVHALGWRLLQIPQAGGMETCYRLCHDRVWIADYGVAELQDQLAEHGLLLDGFVPVQVECCIMVDPSSRIACLRPAESVDGRAHLPLCAGCRQALGAMRAFPGEPDVVAASTALPQLTAMWLSLGNERERRELSHLIRHPLSKILGWAEILCDDETVHPTHAGHLRIIHRAATELQQLLDNVASPL